MNCDWCLVVRVALVTFRRACSCYRSCLVRAIPPQVHGCSRNATPCGTAAQCIRLARYETRAAISQRLGRIGHSGGACAGMKCRCGAVHVRCPVLECWPRRVSQFAESGPPPPACRVLGALVASRTSSSPGAPGEDRQFASSGYWTNTGRFRPVVQLVLRCDLHACRPRSMRKVPLTRPRHLW